MTTDTLEAHEYREYVLLIDAGKSPKQALAAIRDQTERAPQARKNRPGRDEGAHAEPDTGVGQATPQRASKSLTVTIPAAPAKELMPNQQTKQGHWSARSKARKAFRAEAMWQAGLCLPHDWQPLTGPVALDIYVAWPKRRRPDLDAVVSSCKAAIDGLADAGIFADDRQIIEIRATHDYGAPAPGLTRFTITEKSA